MQFPSIRSLKTGSVLLAALAAAALPAFAGDTTSTDSKDKKAVIEKPPTEPRFYMSLMAGGEFDTGITDFTGDGRTVYGGGGIIGRPIPGPIVALSPTPIPAFIQARDFSETHDAAVFNGKLELGYKVLPYLSIFAGFTYSHAGGNDRANVGTVIDTFGSFGTPGQRYNLFAGVGQYQAFAGRAGFKINTPRTILDILHLPHAIKPYATFSAGGKYLDSQYIRFYTDDEAIVDTGRLKLYDDTWVFTVEGALGYDLQLTRNLSLVLENGYGYDTKPDSGALGAAGYSGVSTKGSRVYSTVSLGMKLSF